MNYDTLLKAIERIDQDRERLNIKNRAGQGVGAKPQNQPLCVLYPLSQRTKFFKNFKKISKKESHEISL